MAQDLQANPQDVGTKWRQGTVSPSRRPRWRQDPRERPGWAHGHQTAASAETAVLISWGRQRRRRLGSEASPAELWRAPMRWRDLVASGRAVDAV